MRLQICEVISDLEHLNEETIKKVIKEQDIIKEWAYIVHDKDLNEEGKLKNKHWHIMLRLKEARDTASIGKWFNIAESFVSASKSKSIKSLKFNDMLAYLTHECKKNKHHYDLNEVKTNVQDLEERIKDYIERQNGKAISFKKNKILEEYISRIVSGEIREFNITEKIDEFTYATHTKEIKSAFEYRRKILSTQKRKLEVYYFCGESGSGKTTYAQQIATNKGLSYFVSSSKNDVLDGYAGQDVIILDDLRPASFELCDLLKFLDNNTNSTVKSRYHNKVIEAKIIIITSIYHIEDFFEMTTKDENGDEPIKQLKRRCCLYAIFSDDKIKTFIYNRLNEEYETLETFDNPINKIFPKSAPSDEQRERLKELFTINTIQINQDFNTEQTNQVSKDNLDAILNTLPFY